MDFLNLTPLNPPTKTPFLVHFVAKSGPFGRFGGCIAPPASPPPPPPPGYGPGLLCSVKLADDASADLNVSTGVKRHLQLTHQLICRLTGDNTVSRKMCKGKLKYMQYGTCGSPRIVSTKARLETVHRQPHQKVVDRKRRNYLTSAVTKLFLLNHQLVFCCSHPTSSGIYAGNHYSLETCRMNMLIKCTTALK